MASCSSETDDIDKLQDPVDDHKSTCESEFRRVRTKWDDLPFPEEWHAFVRDDVTTYYDETHVDRFPAKSGPGWRPAPPPSEAMLVYNGDKPQLPNGGTQKLMRPFTSRWFNSMKHGRFLLTEVGRGAMMWELNDTETRGTLGTQMALLCDGILATLYRHPHRVRTWDVATGELIDVIRLKAVSSSWLGERVELAVVDDWRFALGYSSGYIVIFQHKQGADLKETTWISPSNTGAGSIEALSTYGKRLASAFRDGTVAVWDIDTCAKLTLFRTSPGDILTSVHMDQSVIAVGLAGPPYVRIFRACDNLLRFGCATALDEGVHSSSVTSVALLDDTHVMSSSYDRTVVISEIQSSRVVARAKSTFFPSAATVLPDGYIGLTGESGYAIMPPLPGAKTLLKTCADSKYCTGSTGDRWREILRGYRKDRDF